MTLLLGRPVCPVGYIQVPRIGDIELSKHVTWRQRHLLQVRRVPGTHDDPAIIWVVLQFVYDLGQLINTLAGIVGLGILVLGTKVTPLKAVDGAQIANLAV